VQADVTAPSGVFRSLHHRGFRLLMAGQVATSSAQWMEQVARGWLVYDMTGSPILLGAVQAARSLPLLAFGMLGGVLADRFDRKRQMILAQNANLVLSLVLAALILTGHIEAWHVFVTAAMAGAVQAFQQPARQSLIPELVGKGDLMNAVALNSGILNGTRTLGPTFAGLLVVGVGVGGCYLFQAALFLFASVWTMQIALPDATAARVDAARLSIWGSFVDGLQYVRSNQTVLTLLALALVPIVLAQPYSTLVPVFARDVFDIGAIGQGVLLSVPGIGAVLGAGAIAWMGGWPRRSLLLLGGVVVFGAGLIAFALSPWLSLALVALLFVGLASTSYRAVNQTLLQTHTEDGYRGRVMSIYLLDRGLTPLGSLLAGTLAAVVGARDAVAVLGMLTVAFAVALVLRVPAIRDLE
jgi:MFS family permease